MSMEKDKLKTGDMSTVIGIFEDQFLNNLPLTVVKLAAQTRRFTHVNDTVIFATRLGEKINVNTTSFHTKKLLNLDVAKMFERKIKFLPARSGERYASALTNLSYNNKILKKIWKNKFERLHFFVY